MKNVDDFRIEVQKDSMETYEISWVTREDYLTACRRREEDVVRSSDNLVAHFHDILFENALTDAENKGINTDEFSIDLTDSVNREIVEYATNKVNHLISYLVNSDFLFVRVSDDILAFVTIPKELDSENIVVDINVFNSDYSDFTDDSSYVHIEDNILMNVLLFLSDAGKGVKSLTVSGGGGVVYNLGTNSFLLL